jgi:hypothetical protein
MESVFIVTAVVAAVELLRRLKIQDWFAAATIVISALIGGAAGVFQLGGVTSIEAGLIAGLSASGLITVASRVSNGVSANEFQSTK